MILKTYLTGVFALMYNLCKGEKMKISNLFKDEYQCMFLKETDVLLGKKFLKLEIDAKNFSDEKFMEYLKYRHVTICFEKKGVGTLVFSNQVSENVFDVLQKKYKEFPAYYFWASDTLGNFKIVKDGKIQRKFASKGYVYDGLVSSEEQVLGKPCEYEIQNNKIYKTKYDEYTIKISRQEMGEIFDFYVPLKRDEDIEFDSINFYYNLSQGNMNYAMENFSRPEFLQSLFHVGGTHEFDYTKPLIIFKQKNILRFAFFKDKLLKFNVKNAKKLLNLGIFDKLDEKLKKSNLFYNPYYLTDFNFASYFSNALIETFHIEENYETSYSRYLNWSNSEGEYIGKTSSIFYFHAEFIDGNFVLNLYSILKNGESVQPQFVAKLEGFEINKMRVFYNQILDYIFDDDLAEKLKN